MNSTATVILGSAAVGALVSSIITLVGQHIERRTRRRELLLAEAVKMAMAHRETLIKIVEMQRKSTFIPEQAKLVQTYYVALDSLVSVGKFPKGMFTNDHPEDRSAFQQKHGGYAD